MDEQPTCGKGLAEHSTLPAKLSDLTAAMANVLEVHQQALDLTDENARREHEAYGTLAREYRSIAQQLRATAERMAGYRDLPMGRHDEEAMAAPEGLAAFTAFVEVEQDLVALLTHDVERDREMLVAMGGRVAE